MESPYAKWSIAHKFGTKIVKQQNLDLHFRFMMLQSYACVLEREHVAQTYLCATKTDMEKKRLGVDSCPQWISLFCPLIIPLSEKVIYKVLFWCSINMMTMMMIGFFSPPQFILTFFSAFENSQCTFLFVLFPLG